MKIFTKTFCLLLSLIFFFSNARSSSNLSINSNIQGVNLKNLNIHIKQIEDFISSQKNYIGWSSDALNMLYLVNEHFNTRLPINIEKLQDKNMYQFNYCSLYKKNLFLGDSIVLSESKKLSNANLPREERILSVEDYKELIKNIRILNIWGSLADSVPLNDTAFAIINEFILKNDDIKINGLLALYNINKTQNDKLSNSSFETIRQNVLAIYEDAKVNDETKIKALAVLLYVGGSNLSQNEAFDFLINYQDKHNGIFSDSQLTGALPNFFYDEDTNIYAYWALLQLRENFKNQN